MYDPALPPFLVTLKQIEAGSGYWVKMKKAADLKFGDGDSGSRTITKMSLIKAADGVLGQIKVYPNIPSTLFGTSTIEGVIEEEGDIIAALVGDELRGAQSIILHEGVSYVTLNANMKGNESLKLYYWDSSEERGYLMHNEIYHKE